MKAFRTAVSGLAIAVSVAFSTHGMANVLNPFDIQLSIGSGYSNSQIGLLNDAAGFWERALLGYDVSFSAASLQSVSVNVSIDTIDGTNSILAQAGPVNGRLWTGDSKIFVTGGDVTFDAADVATMPDSTFFQVMVHELAHVIGFGTLWNFEFNGTLFNPVLNADGNYIGQNALALYQQLAPAASSIPVTANAHWAENSALGQSELLTPFINFADPNNYISAVTLASFEDKGFIVDYGALSAVPVPGALPFLVTALGALGLFGWRRNR